MHCTKKQFMTTRKLLVLFSFLFVLTVPIELIANTDVAIQTSASVEFNTGTATTFNNDVRPKKKKAKKKKAKRHCEAYESFN